MAEVIKKPKSQQQKQLRFFISSLNSFVGHALVEALRNDHLNDENPHFIVGSLCESENNPVPRGVFRVIDTTKINFLAKVYLDSDVIIYDLNTCNLEEAEFAIKTLKMGDYKDEKILICISNVMVWSNTPPKEKKEGEDQGGEEEGGLEEEPDTEPEQQEGAGGGGGDEDGPPKKVYLKFTEKDYTKRKPLPKYEILKSIETMCISAGNSKQNLRTYVLCSGVLYGNGEDVFYDHFKQAWLQNPPELTVYGDGKNRVPTIHVRDLATFVKKIVERPPIQSYIFAIDHNPKPSQKKLIESISKGLGAGKYKQVSLAEGAMENDNFDIFTLDLRLRPTKVFDAFLEEEQQQDEENPDAPPKFKFDWHCKEGLVKNIDKVVREFNSFRGMRPNKILIQGPPASGKTHFGKMLAKHYNIPHILVGEVVEMVKKLTDAFGDQVREKLEEIRLKMVEEAQAKFDAEKKKKKAPKKGEPVEEFDPSNIIPRLPEDLLIKAYKYRLKQTDCKNRGFLLDGFPKTYEQLKSILMKAKPAAEGEEPVDEDDENAPKIINKETLPDSIIIFDASDDFLKQRVKQLPEQVVAGTHYNEEGMNRRLAVYRKANDKSTGKPILIDFFKENKVEIFEISSQIEVQQAFDSIRSFIERNGPFANYQDHEEKAEDKRKEEVKSEQQQTKLQEEQNQKIKDDKEEEARKHQEEEYKIKMDNLKNQEREILDTKSQPLRQYLADNVVPFLTEGLIELCKTLPEDPVDYLAEYLFKRSLEVQFPDPGSYPHQ